MSEPVHVTVDIHEADSKIFEAIVSREFGHVKMKHMETSDILISWRGYTIAIELKRESDFDNSLHSGRLSEQLARLTLNFDFPCLIIENWHPHLTKDDDEESIRERVRKHEMTVRTLNRKVATYETKDEDGTMSIIEELVRDLKSGRVGVIRRPVTVDKELSDQMRFICGLPNVKETIGERILDSFRTVEHALNNVDSWEEIEGLGAVKVARIKRVLREEFNDD